MPTYPGTPIGDQNFDPSILDTTQPILKDVERAFKNIPKHFSEISLHPNDTFTGEVAYETFTINTVLQKRNGTHFQGIVRLNGKDTFILSGGDNKKKKSQLFIGQMKSYYQNVSSQNLQAVMAGPMGSNTHSSIVPSPVDALQDLKTMNSGDYWHAGGLGLLGNVLAVPIESKPGDDSVDKSKIQFYCVEDALSIKPIKSITIVDDHNKAGCTSLIRLPNGKYLCAVWTDSNDYDKKNRRLSFFFSKSVNLMDGFLHDNGKYLRIDYPYVAIHTGHQPKYQQIQLLIEQSSSNSKCKLYMIGTENSAKLAPVLKGTNRARLYALSFGNGDISDPNFVPSNASMSIVDHSEFRYGGDQYNFNAGTGIYITPEKELALYSVHHFRNGEYVQVAEFYPISDNYKSRHRDLNVVELYQNKNFEGRCLKLYGKQWSQLPDYTKILVEENHFNDKVHSIRYNMDTGSVYELYQDIKYNNGHPGKNKLTLNGTGKWEEIPDLDDVVNIQGLKNSNDEFGDEISASRYV